MSHNRDSIDAGESSSLLGMQDKQTNGHSTNGNGAPHGHQNNDDNGNNGMQRSSTLADDQFNGGDDTKTDKPDEKAKAEPAEKLIVPYRAMFRYADGLDKFLMFFGTLTAIGNGLVMPGFSLIFGDLFDSFNDTNQSVEDAVKPQLYWFIGLGVASGVLSWISMTFWIYTSERQSKRIRENFLRAILRQDMSWFDAHDAGELSTRLASDSLEFNKATGEKVASGIFNFTTFLGGLAVGLYKGWQLALLIVGITPFLGGAAAVMATTLSQLTHNSQAGYAKAGSVADETFGAIKTVQAFGSEDKQVSRYDAYLEVAKKWGIKRGSSSGNMLGFTMFILFAAYGLAMWFGGWLIRHDVENAASGDRYTGGDVIATFFGVLFGAMSLGQAGQSVEAANAGRSAAARLFSIIDRVPPIDVQSTAGKKLTSLRGDIKIDALSFAYPTRKDAPIFSNFSLDIKAGQVIALVGESGSGKSTVSGLVQRFYDPDQGRVTIDGEDLRELNLAWWRECVGVVAQEPVLFDASVEENIRYGDPSAPFEAIQAAARAANAEEFIERLPEKYAYRVGQGGNLLSGGQKQRLAIARALVKKPKVLILDEATSALDNKSEAEVQAALDKVMRKHTTIIIAHRLSTIMKADVIFVLGRGEALEAGTSVIEKGTHRELMALNGVYVRLVSAQDGAAAAAAALTMAQEDAERKARGDDAVQLIRHYSSNNNVEQGTPASKVRGLSPGTPGMGGRTIQKTVSKEKKLTPEERKKLEDEEKKVADSEKVPKVPVSRVFKLMAPDMHLFVLALISSCIIGGVQPVWALLFSDLSAVYYETDYARMRDETRNDALYFLALGAGIWVANFLEGLCLAVVGERLTFRLRHLAYNNLLHQEMGWFDDRRHSPRTLTTRLAIDASLVHTALTKRAGAILQVLAALGVGLGVSFYYGWKLALVVLAILPLLMVSGIMQYKFFAGFSDESNKAFENAGKIAAEACANIRTVSSFNAESSVMKKFSESLVVPLYVGKKKAVAAGFGFGFSQFVIFAAYALTFWYGSTLVDNGELGFGAMLKVIFSIIIASFHVGQASQMMPDVQAAAAATDHIFHLIDRQSQIDSASPAGEKPKLSGGSVQFDNVKFAYPLHPETTILDGLQLTIPAGQTVALVGASGSGKSTIVSLLQRFYDIQSGSVSMDGNKITALNLAYFRQQLGMVSQEPVLFDCSIEENIMYGKPDATHDDVIRACQAANIHDFIVRKLPEQYNTKVGVGGSKLSGGQKQRVAIARALLRQPRVLLLDEATSALDSESEKTVQIALDKLMSQHDRTVIVIAHRLSTVRNADQIAVLNKGRVAEIGSHDELMAKGGLYAALVRTTGKGDNIKEAIAQHVEHAEETQRDQDASKIKIEISQAPPANMLPDRYSMSEENVPLSHARGPSHDEDNFSV